MRHIFRRLLLCCSIVIAQQSLTGEFLPPPADDEQKAAEKLVRDLFKAELAKSTPVDKCATAAKLLQQGIETRDDPAAAFVLLKMAAELGSQGGDVEVALKAVEATAARYEIKPLPMKEKVVEQTARAAATKEQSRRLAERALAIGEEAAQADDFDLAVKVCAKAEAAARAGQDVPLFTSAQSKGKDYRALQASFAKVKEAQAKLTANPDDPDANFAVGRFLLIAKKDAARAIPLLVKASDIKWSEVAKLDAAEPRDAAEQVGLADRWWQLAEALPKQDADALKSRAIFWYSKALPGLTGLTRTKVEKRLADINPADRIAHLPSALTLPGYKISPISNKPYIPVWQFTEQDVVGAWRVARKGKFLSILPDKKHTNDDGDYIGSAYNWEIVDGKFIMGWASARLTYKITEHGMLDPSDGKDLLEKVSPDPKQRREPSAK